MKNEPDDERPRPAKWRVGRRNPFTVYRVADGAHDVEHAREHFVTSFRTEEDARRAVDAVNAQADRVDLDYPAGRWRDVYVRVHGDKEVAATEQVTDTIRIDWSAPNAAGEVDIVGVEVVAATGVEVDGEPTTPPACDCPTTDGAVHLTLVSNPKRRGGDLTVGHTGWRVEAAVETVRAGDPLNAWVPQWISREQAGLLERFVAVLDGEDEDDEQQEDQRLLDLVAQAERWIVENAASRKTYPDSPGHQGRRVALEEAANTIVNVVEGRLTGLAAHYARQALTDPAGSAVGQRGAPTPYDLVEANERALTDIRFRDVWTAVATSMARGDHPSRVAHLALAALRDGGADTGGEQRPCDVCAGVVGRHGDVCENEDEHGALCARADTGGEDEDDEVRMPPPERETIYATSADPHGSVDLNRSTGVLVAICRCGESATMWSGGGADAQRWWEKHRSGHDLLFRDDHDEARQQMAAGSMARAEVTGIKAVLRDRNVTRDEDDSLADTVAQALDGHTRGLARLSTALGVSLDPDDPDPVGRLVEAAGKAREVEVVSGAEAAEMPVGSIVLPWRNGLPDRIGGVAAHEIGTLGDALMTVLASRHEVRVLYRAPAPTPAPLAVGEIVRSGGDLQRLPLGSIVESVEFGAIDKRTDPTCWALPGSIFPVRVVRVGTGGGETGE